MDIRLIKWDILDIEELVSIANNKNVSNTLKDIFPYPYTLEDAEGWISSQQSIFPNQHFAIKINDQLAGGIGCNYLGDVYRKSIEMGYWLGEQFWNKGIATGAVKKMTEYIFTTFDVVRICAPVFETNKSSMKVLEKAGYHLEAIHKKAIYKNEEIMDEYLFVKLK